MKRITDEIEETLRRILKEEKSRIAPLWAEYISSGRMGSRSIEFVADHGLDIDLLNDELPDDYRVEPATTWSSGYISPNDITVDIYDNLVYDSNNKIVWHIWEVFCRDGKYKLFLEEEEY